MDVRDLKDGLSRPPQRWTSLSSDSSFFSGSSFYADSSSFPATIYNLFTLLFTLVAGAYILSQALGLAGFPHLSYLLRRLQTLPFTMTNTNTPAGLVNPANACFQNSIMQGLASLPSLREYLSDLIQEFPSLGEKTTNGELLQMLTQLNDPANNGKSFRIRGMLSTMSSAMQEDAQEYYSSIVHGMDKEIKKEIKLAKDGERGSSVSDAAETKKDEKKEVDEKAKVATEPAKIPLNPLEGLTAQRVGCTTCGYSDGLSLDPFTDLTIPLGTKQRPHDIRECLDEFTKLEYLQEVTCVKCTVLKQQKTLAALVAKTNDSKFAEKLRLVTELVDGEKIDDSDLIKKLNIPRENWVESTKSIQRVVARAPKSLVLHINRSNFNQDTGEISKNNSRVSFPGVLDIGEWCLGASPSGSNKPDFDLAQWPRDPRQTMLPSGDAEASTMSAFQYRLRAVVAHAGGHHRGHYVCFRPFLRAANPAAAEDESGEKEEEQDLGEQWWRYSDEYVSGVPEEKARECGNVFMLFYERIDAAERPIDPTPAAAEKQVISLLTIAEDAPLPPYILTHNQAADQEREIAAAVPLPEEGGREEGEGRAGHPAGPAEQEDRRGEEGAFGQEERGQQEGLRVGQCPYPTPPPECAPGEEEEEASEAESEDGLSPDLTSGPEGEAKVPAGRKPYAPVSPQMMRTAGTRGARSRAGSNCLPLVSAT